MCYLGVCLDMFRGDHLHYTVGTSKNRRQTCGGFHHETPQKLDELPRMPSEATGHGEGMNASLMAYMHRFACAILSQLPIHVSTFCYIIWIYSTCYFQSMSLYYNVCCHILFYFNMFCCFRTFQNLFCNCILHA